MNDTLKMYGSIGSEITNKYFVVAICFKHQPRWRRLQTKNSKCWSFEQNLVRAFSNPLEHLVTIVSPLLLPYHCKYIFKQRFFSEPKRTCDLLHPIHKHYMTFCMQSNFPFAGWTTSTCKTGTLIEFGACKKRRLKPRRT